MLIGKVKEKIKEEKGKEKNRKERRREEKTKPANTATSPGFCAHSLTQPVLWSTRTKHSIVLGHHRINLTLARAHVLGVGGGQEDKKQ